MLVVVHVREIVAPDIASTSKPPPREDDDDDRQEAYRGRPHLLLQRSTEVVSPSAQAFADSVLVPDSPTVFQSLHSRVLIDSRSLFRLEVTIQPIWL